MPPRTWNHPTISAIGQVFPMYHLSLAGIEKAVAELTRLAH
jgi:hypothetical protein